MNKKLFYCSSNQSMKFVWIDSVAATLYSIANSLFMLEKKIKAEETRKTVSIDYYCSLSNEQLKEISILLKNIVLDVLCEDVNFKFTKKVLKKIKMRKKIEFPKNETICLFSGGIDSTLGIRESKKKYGAILGLFVAHQDLGKVTSKVEKIRKSILETESIPLVKLIAPKMGQGYSQLRGFLYILYSAMMSRFVDASRIIVAECGATMYQPRFAPLDTITYTTHPNVLGISKRISEILLGKSLEIITPFEDFTKTEMMTLMQDDNLLAKTHSCITSRWDNNCGTCYACIARMVGSVNLGLSINYFRSNVFERKDDEMLCSFTNFCLNLQLNPDEVDYWSLKTILKYEKQDLFNRVSQDFFLCLKKLADLKKLDSGYEIALNFYLKSKSNDLTMREKTLKNSKYLPDFNKKVL